MWNSLDSRRFCLENKIKKINKIKIKNTEKTCMSLLKFEIFDRMKKIFFLSHDFCTLKSRGNHWKKVESNKEIIHIQGVFF